jgi:hypothetical protein
MFAGWDFGPMDLHKKSVGDALLVAAAGRISRFNQVFALFDHVRDGVAKLAPDSLSLFDAR